MEWSTDLIGFDAQNTYASPSYWAQCLFAEHLGDGTARSTISAENKRFFYSATVSAGDKVLHLKLVNASSVEQPLSVLLTGVSGPHNVRMTSCTPRATRQQTRWPIRTRFILKIPQFPFRTARGSKPFRR
jgi:hypothetical protein